LVGLAYIAFLPRASEGQVFGKEKLPPVVSDLVKTQVQVSPGITRPLMS